MEFRRFGSSGLKVPVLGLGTATFGGGTEHFKTWGTTQVDDAKRMVDVCIDAGAGFFDTANSYSYGLAEEILGQALEGKRDRALVTTKVSTPLSDEPNERGSSRQHILSCVEQSLRRLRTDYLDVLYVHEFDGTTPIEETVRVLDHLVTSGKVRYLGASNFSGWQLMKSLAIADNRGWTRYSAHQVAYSLVQRDYEWELQPLAAEEGVGAVAWSPLGGSALSGKLRRGEQAPQESRLAQSSEPPVAPLEHIYDVVEEVEVIATETGKTIRQVALNWVLCQPTMSSVVLGARTLEQLEENLGAAGWELSDDQLARLDRASRVAAPFPYSHQQIYPEFDPRTAGLR
jgi:aryl-alcohol dehydrogenase-like predicted oxidoreductase